MLIVFENDIERCSMLAAVDHDFENQPLIFGKETDKFLEICRELCFGALRIEPMDAEKEVKLLKKLYGIAMVHGLYVTWYGLSKSCFEPDRFLISGKGHDRYAYVQI